MNHHLQRLLVVVALSSALAAGWWAVDGETPVGSRPELVAVVAPAVEPAVTFAAVPSEPAVISEIPDIEPTATPRSTPFELPESTSFTTVPPAAAAAESAPEAVANTAPDSEPVSEPVSDQAADDEPEAELQEHTISHIPDPPDVGNSDRRETFEVTPEPEANDPWFGVRRCESHNNYSINTGNGFYGAYQFTISTWDWVAAAIGRPDLVGVRPDLASPSDQDRLAQALAFEVDGGGLQHWPVCGRFYG